MDPTDPNDAETIAKFAQFLDELCPDDDALLTVEEVVESLREIRRYFDDEGIVLSSAVRQRFVTEAIRPFVTAFPVDDATRRRVEHRFAEAFGLPSRWAH